MKKIIWSYNHDVVERETQVHKSFQFLSALIILNFSWHSYPVQNYVFVLFILWFILCECFIHSYINLYYIQTRNVYQPENSLRAHIDFSPPSWTRNTNAMQLIFTPHRYLFTNQFIKAEVPTPGQNWILLALNVKELREVSNQQPGRNWILSKELKASVQKDHEELNLANDHVSTLGRESSWSQAFQCWSPGQHWWNTWFHPF